jgi:hypothetical protein
VNAYIKNRCHALKLLIETNAARPMDCTNDHWKNMKRIIASNTKQGEVAKYHAMRTKVNTPSHYGRGRKVGTTSKLVKLLTFGETLLLLFVRSACCVTICSVKKHSFFVFQT